MTVVFAEKTRWICAPLLDRSSGGRRLDQSQAADGLSEDWDSDRRLKAEMLQEHRRCHGKEDGASDGKAEQSERLSCNVSMQSDSPRDQAVSKSVEVVMEDCTESHQTWNEMLGEQSRSHVGTALPAAMAPVRPASRCRILLVSLLQVSTPLSLVVSKLASTVRHLMDSTRLLHTSHGLNLLLARSLHKLVISELNRCP